MTHGDAGAAERRASPTPESPSGGRDEEPPCPRATAPPEPGLTAALGLNWRPGVSKILVHVADAPCHGDEYHDCKDDYGDLGKAMPPLLQRLQQQQVCTPLARTNLTAARS